MKKSIILVGLIIGVSAGIYYHLSTRRVWGFKMYSPPIPQWTEKTFDELDLSEPVEAFLARSVLTTDKQVYKITAKKNHYMIKDNPRHFGITSLESSQKYFSDTPKDKRSRLLWSFYYKNLNGDIFCIMAQTTRTSSQFKLAYVNENGDWKLANAPYKYGNDINNILNAHYSKDLNSGTKSNVYKVVMETILELESKK